MNSCKTDRAQTVQAVTYERLRLVGDVVEPEVHDRYVLERDVTDPYLAERTPSDLTYRLALMRRRAARQ